MRPRFEDYKVMFKVQGKLTALHAQMLVSGSIGLGHPICLFHDEHWDSFLNLEGEKRCNQKGAELLGSSESYWKWAGDFRAHIAKVNTEVVPFFKNGFMHFTEEEAQKYLDLFLTFQNFYGITDFPYSEGMHQEYEKTKDPALAEAMEDFGKLKFEGRDVLNAYMHDSGVYPVFTGSIAIQGGLEPSDGQFLFSEDVLAIARGQKVDADIIRKRRDFYGCGFDGSFTIFSYEECKKYWDEFHPAFVFENELKGIVANKGRATGRVVIAPMLTDPEAIARVVAKMNDGDVLVAESTTPELLLLCKKASAIVTDQGGMLSHAAVVSREMGKPCVIGTQRGTRVLKDGDMVEVDADQGIVRILERSNP